MRKLITTKRPITFSLLFPGDTYHRSPAINFSGDHCRPRPRPRPSFALHSLRLDLSWGGWILVLWSLEVGFYGLGSFKGEFVFSGSLAWNSAQRTAVVRFFFTLAISVEFLGWIRIRVRVGVWCCFVGFFYLIWLFIAESCNLFGDNSLGIVELGKKIRALSFLWACWGFGFVAICVHCLWCVNLLH